MSAEPTTGATDSDALHPLRAEFDSVVGAYNSAIATGKLRTIRAAVKPAHQALFAMSRSIPASTNLESLLFRQTVEAAILDVRWGRAIAVKA